jgi:molybdopterin-guanine dinucleotide biosynthesis protein
MTKFFHVVGGQGSGKSGLILAVAKQLEQRGIRCAGQDPDGFTSRREAVSLKPSADVYFIEHSCDEDLDALPGDTVIRISVQGA